MVKSLHHRGPDSAGDFSTVVKDKKIFLGHARLSIIDLSACGAQPMFTETKDVVIVYNGEIYNFEKLRDKYLKNQPLKSKTDTEVILYLYKKLGIDFVKELNGDFAIALFDQNKSKIFLFRDRCGVKPLYYHLHNGNLIFASEIKSIKSSGQRLSLDKNNLQKFFVFKYSPLDETLFENIKRIPPGHYLEYDLNDQKVKTETFWQFQKNPSYASLSYTEAKEVLFDLTKEAVESQLMSDVPVGTFFSGGIDSSIIAWFIKDKREIIHYSARKSESDLKKEGSTSDFYYAQLLSKKWNLNLQPIDIGSGEANVDLIKKTLFYSDDLIADGSQIPSYLITKEAGLKSRVMLSGMGADELFLGYAGHQISLFSMMLDKTSSLFAGGVNKFFASLNQGKGSFKAYRRYLHKLGKYYSSGILRYGFYNIVGDYENSLSVINGDGDSVLHVFKKYFNESDDIFESISRFEYDNFLVKNLHYMDRMAMANSVEGRVPFLDNNLIDFAYSIPRNYKLSSLGKTKKIVKESFINQLPDYVVNRRKAGFGMPLRSILSDVNKTNELLNQDFFGGFDNFSLKNINRAIQTHVNGQEDNSALLYALISFQEWYKLHLN